MAFKILMDDTRKIIYRSNICSALDPNSQNLCMDLLNDDNLVQPIIKSQHDSYSTDSSDHGENSCAMLVVDPNDRVGCTFLMPPQEDGQCFCACIVRATEDHEQDLANDPDRIHFLCSVNDDQFEEIMSYNDLKNSIEEDGESNVWKFRRITAYQGPLTQRDMDWNGSHYNVSIEWEYGEITNEPLSVIAVDDPVTCATYARDHNLLELKDGWKRFNGDY